MAHVSVTQHHSRPAQEMRAIVSDVAEHLAHRHGVRHRWADDRQLRFSGRGIDGTLTLDDRMVRIELELGLLLRPIRGRIEQELRRELAERLGSSA